MVRLYADHDILSFVRGCLRFARLLTRCAEEVQEAVCCGLSLNHIHRKAHLSFFLIADPADGIDNCKGSCLDAGWVGHDRYPPGVRRLGFLHREREASGAQTRDVGAALMLYFSNKPIGGMIVLENILQNMFKA